MNGKLTERKIQLYLTEKLHDRLLEIAHKNKLDNLKEKLKGESKKADTVNAVIRKILKKSLFKK